MLNSLLQKKSKEFSRPKALDKNWENLKNRFKSPNASKKQSKSRKWISKDLRYIPERSQSVIAEGDARKLKKS